MFGATRAGTMAHGSCAAGFEAASTLEGNCDTSGLWESISGACIPLRCPSQNNVAFASWSDVTVGSTATGLCEAGYRIADGASAPQRTCILVANGTAAIWSEPVGTCVQSMCGVKLAHCHRSRRKKPNAISSSFAKPTSSM